jgi:ASC-1-like (ASCH) protein
MECFGYEKDHLRDAFLKGVYTIYTKEQEEKYGVLGIHVK